MEESKGFDLAGWIVSILFLIATCNTSEPVSITSQESSSATFNLSDPKDEGEDAKYENISTKLTLVLLANKKVYAYESLDVNKGKYYSFDLIRPVILKAKNKFARKFVVVIKPASKADYNITVDVLDEMVINKIDRYAIVDLNESEKKLFINSN